MSRRLPVWDKFSRRQVIAAGLGSTMGAGWLVSSMVRDAQESITSSPNGVGTPVPQGQAGETPGPQGQTGETPAPQDQTGETPATRGTPLTESPDTGGSLAPDILLVSLLSGWEGGDQMEEKQIESIPRGAEAIIGYRYRTVPDDREIKLHISVDAAGRSRNRSVNRTVEESGPTVEQGVSRFETTDWSTGTKQASVVIRNEQTGYVSSPGVTEFGVTES